MPSFEGEVWGWVFVVIGSCIWTSCQAVLPMATRDEGLRLYAGLSRHATPQVLVASLLFEAGQWEAIKNASPLAWGEVLFGALVAAALCFSLWYKLLMRVPADKILPFLLLMPASGVLAGWLLLGEALSAGLLAAARSSSRARDHPVAAQGRCAGDGDRPKPSRRPRSERYSIARMAAC